MNRAVSHKGFTLIEVVVAIAISAVVITLSYQGFNTAQRGVEAGRELLEEINAMDRTWQVLGQDLRHLLPPVAATSPTDMGNVKRVFRGETLREGTGGDNLLLQLTRGDWFNPTGRLRSDLQQVIYRVDEYGSLWRNYRPDRNMPVDDWLLDAFLQQRLLDNIHSIDLRFLSTTVANNQGDGLLRGDDYSRDWDDIWPGSSSFSNSGDSASLELPIALLIRIELESGMTSERLYEISHTQ